MSIYSYIPLQNQINPFSSIIFSPLLDSFKLEPFMLPHKLKPKPPKILIHNISFIPLTFLNRSCPFFTLKKNKKHTKKSHRRIFFISSHIGTRDEEKRATCRHSQTTLFTILQYLDLSRSFTFNSKIFLCLFLFFLKK